MLNSVLNEVLKLQAFRSSLCKLEVDFLYVGCCLLVHFCLDNAKNKYFRWEIRVSSEKSSIMRKSGSLRMRVF